MMLFTYSIVDFHLFYDGAVDIQIWALLTRSRCKVSDTQVTFKVCWPLVSVYVVFFLHPAQEYKSLQNLAYQRDLTFYDTGPYVVAF